MFAPYGNPRFLSKQDSDRYGGRCDRRTAYRSIRTAAGTSNGVITDIDGKYSIQVPSEATLEFSYVGMVKQAIKVGNRSVIDVQMQDDSQMLAETVVIGYGSAKKRDLTGSITNIKGDEIANKPVVNPVAALQGKIAGVQVINSGKAGADPEIRVRGTNSINGYKPLYVVDGLFNDNINFLNPQTSSLWKS
mgnify:CR=1 FL=1